MCVQFDIDCNILDTLTTLGLLGDFESGGKEISQAVKAFVEESAAAVTRDRTVGLYAVKSGHDVPRTDT